MGKALIIEGLDFSQAGLGQVRVNTNIGIEKIWISNAPASFVGIGIQLKAKIYPANTSERGVVWSIVSGGTYASISSNTGVLTVLSGALSSSVTVRAESTSDPSLYDEKTIIVTYSGQSPAEYIYGLRTDGNAGIQTNYIVNQNTEIRAKFVFHSRLNKSFATFYGNWSGVSNTGIWGFYYANNTSVWRVLSNVTDAGAKQIGATLPRDGDIVELVHAPSSIEIDGNTTAISTYNQYYSVSPLCIFAYSIPGTSVSIPDIAVVEFDIYENGTKVVELRPARLEGALGLYDNLSGDFFTNAYGSGSFSEETQ